jgi:hypothetical protein
MAEIVDCLSCYVYAKIILYARLIFYARIICYARIMVKKLNREYMVDVWMEEVHPMSEKVYFGELYPAFNNVLE